MPWGESDRRVIVGPRRSGRTTKLIEAAIDWMGENEGEVLLTGAHPQWVRDTQKMFKHAGLVNIEALSWTHILNGWLSGRGRGNLLCIDDGNAFPVQTFEAILHECRCMQFDVAYVLES